MPVLREWFKVDAILGKKTKNGIIHYLIKWSGYKKKTWEPFFNVGSDLICDFEEQRRRRQQEARVKRFARREIKKELGEPLQEIPIPGRPPKRRNLKW